MSLVDEAQARVASVNQSADLEGLLLEAKKSLTNDRPKHFYVRDLVNPQQAYWDLIGERPEKSDELKRILAYGTLKHAEAGFVLSRLEGFSGAEAKLDGAAADFPGVRGKIDLRLGHSITEFKTTPYALEAEEDVWEKVPQDVEQLLLYAILWPHNVDTHYLIFYTVGKDEPIRVFKVTIKDRGTIRNTFKQRMGALQKAVETHGAKLAKRCRYMDSPCAERDADLCECKDLDQWNVAPLKEATLLERDAELEEEIQRLWDETATEHKPISAWDLETPRRAFARLTGAWPDEPYVGPDMWAWKALAEADLVPGPLEFPPKASISEPLAFTPRGVWIKRKVTQGAKAVTKLTPGIIRTWDKDYHPQPKYLGNKFMQLAALCALANRETGLLILETPQLAGEVVAFEFQFKDLKGFRKILTERLGLLAQALGSKDSSVLPTCAQWLKDLGCENCLCENGD